MRGRQGLGTGVLVATVVAVGIGAVNSAEATPAPTGSGVEVADLAQYLQRVNDAADSGNARAVDTRPARLGLGRGLASRERRPNSIQALAPEVHRLGREARLLADDGRIGVARTAAPSLAAELSYTNRLKIRDYAFKHVYSYNSAYYAYDNDCTNFISQFTSISSTGQTWFAHKV